MRERRDNDTKMMAICRALVKRCHIVNFENGVRGLGVKDMFGL